MPSVNGKSNNPNGRPKGVPNKSTTKFKEALNGLLEHCADDMLLWLQEIDDPKDRFNVLKDFAEYIHPKLARSETRFTDSEGNDRDMNVTVNRMVFNADNRDKP